MSGVVNKNRWKQYVLCFACVPTERAKMAERTDTTGGTDRTGRTEDVVKNMQLIG